MGLKPVRVGQLNSYIGRVLKTDPILGNISVIGEISNLKFHSSGHVYFSLKDESSKVNCFLANVKSYIASPFFFSTKGYALLVNTTFQTVFDMACTRKDRISFADGSGVFDIFLFAA